MKILMVLERDFPPDLRVENEILSLQSASHQVLLACYSLKNTSKPVNIEEWNSCKVFKKNISPFVYKSSIAALKFPFYFRFWKKHIQQIIKTEKPDAIHIHDLPLAQVGYQAAKKYGLKFVLDLHENWPAFLEISKHANTFLGKMLSSINQWKLYELKYCKKADTIIVVIDEARERLINLGIAADKILRVANYPQLDDFKDIYAIQVADTQKPILFYAGGIAEHRGLQFVVRAIPKLKETYPMLECWILGEGNYKNYLENLTTELGISQNVKFFGQVPYKTVLEKLIQSTITLIPHVKSAHTDSTIPHKLFQYIYSGRPVLSSDCLPIVRILKESNAGKVYKWDSPEEFAYGMLDIMNNIQEYKLETLQKQITEKYNWQTESIGLCQIYKS